MMIDINKKYRTRDGWKRLDQDLRDRPQGTGGEK